MGEGLYIFVADYVPLNNKGEEAIIRGIEDLLGADRPVKFAVLGPVREVVTYDNVTIFPYDWVFPGRIASSHRKRQIIKLLVSLKLRFGIYGSLRNLTDSKRPEYRQIRQFFEQSDCIIVGHDASFSLESAGIIHLARASKKCVGIMGAGFSINPRLSLFLKWLYKRAIEESDFCVLREQHTYELVKSLDCRVQQPILALDPAFAMRPAPAKQAEDVLSSYALYRQAKQHGKPVVGVTVCEKSIVYTASFRSISHPAKKRKMHHRFVAGILDKLVKEVGALIIFLPHSIEKDGNDIEVAQHVVGQMSAASENAVIIERDLSARLLKSIIRELDFLLGERTHSMIGAFSVQTAFVGLTNQTDMRTHDIIGDMCGCSEQLIDMDAPDFEVSREHVLALFQKRENISAYMSGVYETLKTHLDKVAVSIRQKITDAKNTRQ